VFNLFVSWVRGDGLWVIARWSSMVYRTVSYPLFFLLSFGRFFFWTLSPLFRGTRFIRWSFHASPLPTSSPLLPCLPFSSNAAPFHWDILPFRYVKLLLVSYLFPVISNLPSHMQAFLRLRCFFSSSCSIMYECYFFAGSTYPHIRPHSPSVSSLLSRFWWRCPSIHLAWTFEAMFASISPPSGFSTTRLVLAPSFRLEDVIKA